MLVPELTAYRLGNDELLAPDQPCYVIFQGGRFRYQEGTTVELHDWVHGSELQRSNTPMLDLLINAF